MKTYIYAIVISCFILQLSCKPKSVKTELNTFLELPDPTNDTLSDWSPVLKKGLQSSYVSIDNKYSKSLLPQIQETYKHSVTGWKGEKLSAQILLWSAEDINNVTFEIADLQSSSSKIESVGYMSFYLWWV